MNTVGDKNLYFDDPRLKMSLPGRVIVRFFIYTTYGVLLAGAVILSLSDINWLKSSGLILGLFLINGVLHLGRADRSLARLPKNETINIARYLTPESFRLIEKSFDRALFAGGDFTLHLAISLAGRKDVRHALERMDVKPDELEQKIEEHLEKTRSKKNNRESLFQEAELLLEKAFTHAQNSVGAYVEPKDIFSALSEINNEHITKLFQLFDIDTGDLENALIFSRFKRKFYGLKRLPASLAGLIGRPYRVRHRVMNRAWTARPTPFLDQYGQDITDLARGESVGFLIGHQAEYDRLTDVLSRPGNPNALLIGEVGSGKSTLVAHLAFNIVRDRVPPPLFDKRIVALDIGRMVAGAQEGELQNRVRRAIDEIIRAGNIILYIPDAHNLVKTSGQLHLSAADMLIPAIKSNAFSVIGATYPKEYKQLIEPNSDFVAIFEPIRVQEINEQEAIKFLTFDSFLLERQYRMTISFGAVKQAVLLAKKYFRQKLLPLSAKDLLKEALADTVEKGKKTLGTDDIIRIAERKVNIPIHRVKEEEVKKLLNLEETIHQRLIDQEEAVKAVARAMREYRSGLSREGGPIATFLFVGPTGVGKTELSKILAKIQFGSVEAMARFDMSEYQDKKSIARLIGAPDASQSGALTDAVAERPYSLILLDEFEKAHPDILNIFLQVFDDGRLTDSSGRTVDFQNTIIIATSNAHSEFIKTSIEAGKKMEDIADELKKKLTDYFRPELINRFSGIVVFKSLSLDDIEKIAWLHLDELSRTLKEKQGIEVEFSKEAVKKVAELGYDPAFGARPLRGVISEKLRSVFAERILKGEIVKGSHVMIDVKDNKFIFNA